MSTFGPTSASPTRASPTASPSPVSLTTARPTCASLSSTSSLSLTAAALSSRSSPLRATRRTAWPSTRAPRTAFLGIPILLAVRNEDHRPRDYSNQTIDLYPRPSHAYWT
ncbi:hypothetical protein G7046_g5696 [Stylonectria norvegica]|nr:hypothetical protein G7046_g5696 [Stylonectria norvegica]